MKEKLFIIIQYLLPKKLLSRIIGYLAITEIKFVKNFLIKKFITSYKVNMTGYQRVKQDEFKNFNDFFTRELKLDKLPIKQEGKILSSAEGTIAEFGDIESGYLFQCKKHKFSLSQLLNSKHQADRYNGGKFIIIYLSPANYHRVHMPFDGELINCKYIPGSLFSVNNISTNHIKGIFAKNERMICEFINKKVDFISIMIGAAIVAGIKTSWGMNLAPAGKQSLEIDLTKKIYLKQTDEMGSFYLGSTSILLFPPKSIEFEQNITENQQINLGQSIASLL